MAFWEMLGKDAQYALRSLRRDAGFFVAAVCIIGLGVGACSTIFSVVNAVLVRPLPFHEPERLVWVANHRDDTADMSEKTTQVNHFLDLRQQSQSFSDMAAYVPFYGVGDNKLTGEGEPERLTSVPVSQNFFAVLGVRPQMGRYFSAEESKFNGPKAVMLSNGLWKRRFGADEHIVGRALTLDDEPVTVVGVLPASFDFATIFAPGSQIDLFSPFPLTEETNKYGNELSIIGRLKPGATVPQAQAEASVLSERFRTEHPERNDFVPRLSALATHVRRGLRPALLTLAGAVGVVMMIVCANLSNLLLARSAARQKEIAIRVALGAERRHLVQQILTESVLLSCSGAALGVILAFAGARGLAHLSAVSIPMLADVKVDVTALGFALLLAVTTGLAFGLAPALQASKMAVQEALKENGRGTSHGKGHAWMRNILVVAEISLACVLLTGAGLLVRSFLSVLDVNLGFRPEQAAALRIDPSSAYKTQQQKNVYYTEALRRVAEVQGIEGTGLSDALPLGHNRSWGVAAKGVQYTPQTYPVGFPRIISEGYFHAMEIKLVEGRDFSQRDDLGTLRVLIVNERLAKNLWPGENPVGKIAHVDVDRTVVGVVRDVRHMALEEGSGNEFYIPIRQTQDYGSVDMVVRSSMPTTQLASRLREALRPIEPNLPTGNLRTLQTMVDRAASPRRFVVLLLGGFAAFALGLACLGIYAVISYSVNQRKTEIGIRMALGASPGMVQRLVLGETLRLAGMGVMLGLIGALVVTRLLASLLYGVSSTDPLTFAGVIAVLAIVAGAAGAVPAMRAARIEPMAALRES